ncbi:hypothetical protein AP285_00515 [Limnospira platensis YZ]|nr:hypothetical protein AP285_00515 [Arthrospira platensis YZ]KDR56349.1 hypothetical protein APPUASWS_017430 [Arthrospira platensis str. Paraca]
MDTRILVNPPPNPTETPKTVGAGSGVNYIGYQDIGKPAPKPNTPKTVGAGSGVNYIGYQDIGKPAPKPDRNPRL